MPPTHDTSGGSLFDDLHEYDRMARVACSSDQFRRISANALGIARSPAMFYL